MTIPDERFAIEDSRRIYQHLKSLIVNQSKKIRNFMNRRFTLRR